MSSSNHESFYKKTVNKYDDSIEYHDHREYEVGDIVSIKDKPSFRYNFWLDDTTEDFSEHHSFVIAGKEKQRKMIKELGLNHYDCRTRYTIVRVDSPNVYVSDVFFSDLELK